MTLYEVKITNRSLRKRTLSLKRPLILDGSMGTKLQQRGVVPDHFLWSSIANLTDPATVTRLHQDYISAGADIITTNTFRTNPHALRLSNYGISEKDFVFRSVGLALNAINEKDLLVAGSNAPAEDCYQFERRISAGELDYNHKTHIELLWEAGCDIIWNETQSHWDEIKIICEFCSSNSLPFVINLYFEEGLKLLSGEPVSEAVKFIENYSPAAVGFNCVKPAAFIEYIEQYTLTEHWGSYFNCGSGAVTDKTIGCAIDPDSYAKLLEPLLILNPSYEGSCCGSGPEHTKAIKGLFNELYRN